jgi:hypothetical protein
MSEFMDNADDIYNLEVDTRNVELNEKDLKIAKLIFMIMKTHLEYSEENEDM